uniref:Uncharacterized protein n=1 Tax=Mycena chlorophos TaxID=658473 RepID=A0ABQ0LBR3_MYCCL|nr:predicted protein [Mycena chlorophos]
MHERLTAQLERDYPNRSRFLDLATVAQEPLLRLLFETIRSDANAVVNLESTTNTPDVALVLNLDDGATAETQVKARQAEAESRLLCQRSAWTCVWQRDCRIAGSRLQTGSRIPELLLLPLTDAVAPHLLYTFNLRRVPSRARPAWSRRRCRRQGIACLESQPVPVDKHEEKNQAIASRSLLGQAASGCEGLTPCWLISAIQAALRGSISHIPRVAYLGRASPELHQALHPPTTTSGIRFPHSLIRRHPDRFQFTPSLRCSASDVVVRAFASSYDRSLLRLLAISSQPVLYTFGWWAATGS